MFEDKKTTALLIILLTFLVYIITFPAYFNKGVVTINEKLPFTVPQLQERDFQFGLDLQGGAHLVYEADFSDVPAENREQRMEGLRNLIERRVDLYGIADAYVRVTGERLIVEIPGAHDLEEAINVIGETPFLDFREITPEKKEKIEEVEDFLGKPLMEITSEDFGKLEESDIENWEVALEDPFETTDLTGRHLESAGVSFHHVTNEPFITLRFTEEGAVLFEEITERNIGESLATFLDGELLQRARVEEKISGGEAQITGDFTIKEAQEIARDLRIGALPVPINLLSQQSIGPEVGEDSFNAYLYAGMIGFILIITFMAFVYRLAGVVSAVSLSIYGLLVLFFFQVIPINLTLSGLAGFILSVGMAIDANVLIFSRMKEEMRKGNSLKKGIEEGYNRAWPSIRDGNFTTLMVAVILFFITTSFVRGFAVTLIIGLLVSIFTAMIITRGFLNVLGESKLGKIRKLWL